MKVGVSSYSFSKYLQQTGCNYLKLCDLAKEMGFDGIEFTDLLPEVSGKPALEAAAEIRAHCEKLGLEVAAYTVGANFLCDDPEKETARMQECVDVAAALGAKLMRHDCCWGLPKDQGVYTWRNAIEDTAPYIRRVTEYAEKKGVRTCTENHGFIMQDSNRVEQLIRTVNHPNYGWLVDMGNFLCADEEPRHAVGIAAPYAVHAHVKDFLYKSGQEDMPVGGWFGTRGGNYLRGTVIGHGVVPVRACVHILQNAGYDGYLSVEFEGREETLPALENAREYLRKLLG